MMNVFIGMVDWRKLKHGRCKFGACIFNIDVTGALNVALYAVAWPFSPPCFAPTKHGKNSTKWWFEFKECLWPWHYISIFGRQCQCPLQHNNICKLLGLRTLELETHDNIANDDDGPRTTNSEKLNIDFLVHHWLGISLRKMLILLVVIASVVSFKYIRLNFLELYILHNHWQWLLPISLEIYMQSCSEAIVTVTISPSR